MRQIMQSIDKKIDNRNRIYIPTYYTKMLEITEDDVVTVSNVLLKDGRKAILITKKYKEEEKKNAN